MDRMVGAPNWLSQVEEWCGRPSFAERSGSDFVNKKQSNLIRLKIELLLI
jgi:hypothetical protein